MSTDNKNNPTKTVLIAEDNPVVVKTIEIALTKMGYKVAGIASDGEEAIELAISTRPDIILMDIEMPKLDGLQATRQILEQFSVPIIIVTSHHDQDFVKRASIAGAAAFLTKPPIASEIDRAITIANARHQDLEELRRLNKELKQALKEIKTLQGIIPICASCKKIRDDKGYWEKIESFIASRSEAQFSHGICPDCAHKLYPEIAKDIDFS